MDKDDEQEREYRELLRLARRARRTLDEWALLALLDPAYAAKKEEIYDLMRRVAQIEKAAKDVWDEIDKKEVPDELHPKGSRRERPGHAVD